MNLDFNNIKNSKNSPVISMVSGIAKKLFMPGEGLPISTEVDEESNGRTVKKPLRCSVSSCFDKQSICCKECDIKKCRYKCNFIDKETCEHQFR